MELNMGKGHIAISASTKHASDTGLHSPRYGNGSHLTPTISVEDFCSEEPFRSRPESRTSTSSVSSGYLTIQGQRKSNDRRPKSADTYRRKSDSSKQTIDSFSLRKVASENILCSEADLKECKCTCSSSSSLTNTGVSGSQLISFYSLWRNNQPRTLGKKVEIPSYMQRKSDYRTCGCKTRLYEKTCSKEKSLECCCHEV